MSAKPGGSKVSFRKPPGAQASPAQGGGLALSREGDVAIDLDLSLIEFDPDQHRQSMDDTHILEMAASIEVNNVIQHIVVRPANAAGRYKLVIGERRVRGSMLANKQTIPALVRNYTDLEADIVQVVENEQRKNVNPLHTARKLRRMLTKHTRPDGSEMEHAELAKMIGKGEAYVSQHLRLLALPPTILAMAENTTLRDVDTLANIGKLIEIDAPAAEVLIRQAADGKKVTRADSSAALRDAKVRKGLPTRRPKDEPSRDPKTEDFINGRPDGLAALPQAAPARGKATSASVGLEIVVELSPESSLNQKHWKVALQRGRSLIELSSLIAAQPGKFQEVRVLFEESGMIWVDVPLKDLIIVEINKV